MFAAEQTWPTEEEMKNAGRKGSQEFEEPFQAQPVDLEAMF
jgi:hypothetical protein